MRVELPGVTFWRHDLGNCLHCAVGSILQFHGLDPLELIGSNWNFEYISGDVRRAEYYFPCWRDSTVASMAPHFRVSSAWHIPKDADHGWEQVRAVVAGGRPAAVAVDNYHLPFRPAYRDVHANHLVVVFGFDDRRGTVAVVDAVPPRFRGEIAIRQLAIARDSSNPVCHERDMFFTAEPIANRWLEVIAPEPEPAVDAARLRAILTANVVAYAGELDGGERFSGLPGVQRFLAAAASRLADRDPAVVDEVFVVAGVALAVGGLHGDFLAGVARRLRLPALAAIARDVDRIAHHWSAVRIIVASGRDNPARAGASLVRRASLLAADQAAVLTRMKHVVAGLEGP